MEHTRTEIANHLAAQGNLLQHVPETGIWNIPDDTTHVVFVVDTSGSMRDPMTDAMRASTTDAFEQMVAHFPRLRAIQLLDADGRFIAGGAGSWIPNSAGSVSRLTNALHNYPVFTRSGLAPGIQQALYAMYDLSSEPIQSLAVVAMGDELVPSSAQSYAEIANRILEPLAPDETTIRIHMIQFPMQQVQYATSQMARDLPYFMSPLTKLYGGNFILWPY